MVILEHDRVTKSAKQWKRWRLRRSVKKWKGAKFWHPRILLHNVFDKFLWISHRSNSSILKSGSKHHEGKGRILNIYVTLAAVLKFSYDSTPVTNVTTDQFSKLETNTLLTSRGSMNQYFKDKRELQLISILVYITGHEFQAQLYFVACHLIFKISVSTVRK